MFKNLPTEVIKFCFVPFVLIIIVDIIAFILFKKRDKVFRFNYFFKISMIIAVAIVLPLIIGYTAWVIYVFYQDGLLADNILYIGFLVGLSLLLAIVITLIYHLGLKDVKKDKLDVLEEIDDAIYKQKEKEEAK